MKGGNEQSKRRLKQVLEREWGDLNQDIDIPCVKRGGMHGGLLLTLCDETMRKDTSSAPQRP